jgi:peptide/nickel transport system substrate-binding protein
MINDSYDLTSVSSNISGTANLVKACRDDVYKMCPALAESWQADADFTQWTFKIRENVLWHDGAPFTAEDAKFWLELAYFGAKVGDKVRATSWYKANLGDIKKVDVLSGNRLRVTLGQRTPQYLYTLAEPRQTIQHPRHLAQSRIEKGEVNLAPLDIGLIGTGAFKFHNWERGVRHQVRRFDKYWEKDEKGRQLPYLDGIDFAVMRDPSAFDAAFRTGRVEGAPRAGNFYLTPERKVGYDRDLGDRVWYAEIGNPVAGLSLNLLKPGPLQDVRVRKALFLWSDQDAFIQAIFGGFGFNGIILHPKNPIGTADFMTWPGLNPATKERDRAEARRLMAAAGYPNGFKMDILLPAPRWTFYGEFLNGHLKPLGIDMVLALKDEAGYSAARLNLDHDSEYGGTYGWVIPEATEADLTIYSISKASRVKHEDKKVDEYFRRLNNSVSLDERVKVWREFERYWFLEQAYSVPLGGRVSLIPYRSYVKGLIYPPERVQENLDFVTVWLDK